jgi:hypothetical protein
VRIQVCRPLGKDIRNIREIMSIRDIWIIVGFRLIRVIEDNGHNRLERVISKKGRKRSD